MKKSAFEDYREALEGAGPKVKKRILARAEEEKNMKFPDFARLSRLTSPDSI